jgi:hypothetical protein
MRHARHRRPTPAITVVLALFALTLVFVGMYVWFIYPALQVQQ